MNFTNSPYESLMKEPSYVKLPPGITTAPTGSRCEGCPYWRGIGCVTCFRELLKKPKREG